ncbi:phospholipase D family protein [Ralstonia solanacearum]|nr:phospholipase D family protein [Ralstonia solanacearum]NKG02238.1 phospholipase D family protein [Ralstonia solanacearum]
MRRLIVCAALLALAPVAGANSFAAGLLDTMRSAVAAEPTNAPDSQAVEIAFSPDGRAEALVLKVIRSAKSSIRLAGYTFTSPAIVRALADAKRRGVDVAVVVDYKNNLVENRSNTSRQALNLLVNAGIPTRTVSVYPIHHDKYIVVDGLHVETGSFNFTTAAARRNSENVVVLWNNPDAARQYIAHWQSRWEQGQQYQSSY